MKAINLHNLQRWLTRNKYNFPGKLRTLQEGYWFTFQLATHDNVLYTRSIYLCAPWQIISRDLNNALDELRKIAMSTYGNSCTIAA